MSRLIVEARMHDSLADPGDKDRALIGVSVSDTNGLPVNGLDETNFDFQTLVVGAGGANVQLDSIQVKGDGYYVLSVIPISAGTWKHGTYIIGIIVNNDKDRGQTITKDYLP